MRNPERQRLNEELLRGFETYARMCAEPLADVSATETLAEDTSPYQRSDLVRQFARLLSPTDLEFYRREQARGLCTASDIRRNIRRQRKIYFAYWRLFAAAVFRIPLSFAEAGEWSMYPVVWGLRIVGYWYLGKLAVAGLLLPRWTFIDREESLRKFCWLLHGMPSPHSAN